MFDASSVFLLIFLVALGLTLVSFVAGFAHLNISGSHGHVHLDANHFPTGHLDHVQIQHGHFPVHGHIAADVGHPHLDAHDSGAGAEGVSPLNVSTLLAFLTWFGGTGYIATAHFGLAALAASGVGVGVGLVGGSLVFLFLTRVLLPGQTPYLREDEHQLPGTVGRLTVGIREGGTGELVYSRSGSRHVISARSESGRAIERGVEVAVVRFERGFAYVEPFDSFLIGQDAIETG